MPLNTLLLVGLALLAFAGNSLLNRAGVASEAIDPQSFAFIRVLSGAVFLAALAGLRGLPIKPRASDAPGIGALALYMAGFSVAYSWLDAGLGALILFGVVQVTVIGWGLRQGARPTTVTLLGLLLAFAGLVWLLRPDTTGTPIVALAAMAAAGLGWGIYTLLGRGAPDPLARTARNFIGAVPLSAVLLFWQSGMPSANGIALAALSGVLTSGAGYAVWYHVLPKLSPVTAGSSQLSVPPLTALLGAVLLGEAITLELAAASLVILGGVALTFLGARSPQSTRPR